MTGRHRAPHDPEAKRLEREAVKRERAARAPAPANRWLVKFSIAALVLTAAFGVFVWFENPRGMWVVGLSALIHLINLVRETRAHLRHRAASTPEGASH